MEILRVSSFSGNVHVDVPEGTTLYNYTITDSSDGSVISGSNTSTPDGVLHVAIPTDYDADYTVSVDAESVDDVLVTIVRPYVDPNTRGTTATEIAEYAKNEEIARALIDSVIPEGFYYRRHILETVGLGADYLPVWVNAKKVLKVTENNVVVYNSALTTNSVVYELTKDKTAIVQKYDDAINRLEGASIIMPGAYSDYLDNNFYYRGFPKTYDYVIDLAVGYNKVPADIVRAAELLIDDLACGRLEYYKKYIADYNTDQFKLKFDKQVFEGTGNIIVDKILSKYAKSIRTVGVL